MTERDKPDKLIINSPFEEPARHWSYIRETRKFSLKDGRRPAGYVIATEGSKSFDDPGVLKKIKNKGLDLGQEPIKQVPFRTWLCRTTIINNHLANAIKPEILINANMGKYDWITFGCPS